MSEQPNITSAGNLVVSNNLVCNGNTTIGGNLLCDSASIPTMNTDTLTTKDLTLTQGTLTANNIVVNGNSTFLTAPTYSGASTSNTQLINKKYCDDKVSEGIAGLINSSPSTLDTLKEISDAINGDASFGITIQNSLNTKAPINNAVLVSPQVSTSISTSDNSNLIASTSYVKSNLNSYARLDGASFSGNISTPAITVQNALIISGNIISSGGTNISPTELSQLEGASSNIQSQLNYIPIGYLKLDGTNTMTSDLNLGGNKLNSCSGISGSQLTLTGQRLNYTNGIISNVNSVNTFTATKTLISSSGAIATIICDPFYKRSITFSTPVSVSRTYSNPSASGSANIITEQLNSITYTINKNGVLFTSGTCGYSDTIPSAVVTITSSPTTSSRTYEVYITNASLSFTPSESSTIDTYIINFTFNFTSTVPSTNFTTLSFGYYTNTDESAISKSTGLIVSINNGANYQSVNYSTNIITTNTISNQSTVYVNELVSKDIVNSGTIYNTNHIVTKKMIGAYMIDGTRMDTATITPIFFSTKYFRANVDNYWMVEPGYKIRLYGADAFGSPVYGNIDNANGTEPLFASSADLYGSTDQVNSVRLYFGDTEQTNTLWDSLNF